MCFPPRKADRNIIKEITVFSPASSLLITFLNVYFTNVFSAEATCHYMECQRVRRERTNISYFIPGLGWLVPHIMAHVGLTTTFQGLGQTPLQTGNEGSFKKQAPQHTAKIQVQVRLILCVLSLHQEESLKAQGLGD